MYHFNKQSFFLSIAIALPLQANILDRIEYKLARVSTQTNILANEVNEIEDIINGEPHVPFSNPDGNLYPVELATFPVSLARISEFSRLARSQAALRIPNIQDFGGIWWRNDEGSVWFAVDPTDDRHMVAVMVQDRSNLEVSLGLNIRFTFDAGLTWGESEVILSRCQGPTIGHSNSDFQQVTRPSVVFSNDGSSIYLILVASNMRLDGSGTSDSSLHAEEAVVCIKSHDGGQSWTSPQIIFGDDGAAHRLESPTIWVNPFIDNTVYAVWSDMQFFAGNGNNSFVKFSRSLDGGTTWEPAVDALVVDSSIDSIAPLQAGIVVDPQGSHPLYLLVKNTQIFTDYSTATGSGIVVHSLDGGLSWNVVNEVPDIAPNVAQDPDDLGTYIRTGAISFDSAINTINGKLYVAFQNGMFAPPGLGGVIVAVSYDGGLTFPTFVPVNPTTLGAQAFNPSIIIAGDGSVGVLFYDFRNHTNPNSPALETDVWLAVFDEDLNQIDEIRITPESFDTRQFMRANLDFIGIDGGAKHYFPGDYCKMQFTLSDFVAAFQVTNPPYGVGPSPLPTSTYEVDLRNRQDILFICPENPMSF